MTNWWVVAWLVAAMFFILFIRGRCEMVNIKEIQDEIAAELRDENNKRAKAALKQNARDIAAAQLVLANLERKKLDLIAAIGDGTF